MKEIFLKILLEINKLPSIDKKTFHNLNTFQLEVLSKIITRKKVVTSALLKSHSKLSKAQKYRYLKELVNKGFCKKKHNVFFKQ
ncbi:hypothetical protein OAT07_01800 [Candidatus Pelagibacter sp.]|nr:hypothetical protein [Candidatus Pelagibacter sp.]